MTSSKKNLILITGASSGIGQEFACQTAALFSEKTIDEIWLLGRSREKLQKTADSLTRKTRILAMDLTKEGQLDRLEDTLQEHQAVVRMLINCAGYGLMGPFTSNDRIGQLGEIRLNCEALTDITYRMLPYMRPGSRILQMASSAAFLPQPDFAVYAASKAYVLSFSRALGEELKKNGIYVTAICPGPVDTPFFEIAEKNGKTLAIKKYTMVSAGRVVSLALKDSFLKKPVSVCSLPIKAFYGVSKLLPHQLLLDIMRHMKG